MAFLNKLVQKSVLGRSEIEVLVREATNNEPWGPTGNQMKDISRASNNYEDFPVIMDTLFARLGSDGKNHRFVYKALLCLDYLIRNGSDQCVREMRTRIMEIKTLSNFNYFEGGKDVGINVRERARQVAELLLDDERLRAERTKARQNSEKYAGQEGGATAGSRFGGGDDYSDRPSARGGDTGTARHGEEDDQYTKAYKTARSGGGSNAVFEARGDDSAARPRAASGGSTTTPQPKPTPPAPVAAAPVVNIFDLDIAPAAPTRQSELDFLGAAFSAPPPSSNGGFHNAGFGGSNFGPTPNFGSAPAPVQAPLSTPAPVSSDPFGFDLSGSSSPAKPKTAFDVPSHLVDFSFGKQDDRKSSANKPYTPMGAMPGTVSTGAKPQNQGFGAFQAPVAQPASSGPNYDALRAPVYTQPAYGQGYGQQMQQGGMGMQQGGMGMGMQQGGMGMGMQQGGMGMQQGGMGMQQGGMGMQQGGMGMQGGMGGPMNPQWGSSYAPNANRR